MTTKRIHYLQSTIAICLIAQFYLSWKLWVSEGRTYPKLPVIENLSFDLSIAFENLFIWLAIVALGAMLFRRLKKWALPFFLVCISILIFDDINRLQVWMYQWLLMLAITIFIKPPEKAGSAIVILLAAIYFWSGLYKFNIYFVKDTVPWLVAPYYEGHVPAVICYLAAAFELSLGLLLLMPSARKYAKWAVLLFHVGILLLLGPYGLIWNVVVWPWNIALIVIVWLLTSENDGLSFSWLFENSRQYLLQRTLLIAFALAPALNHFGHWPETLSFKMYTGTNPEGIFYFTLKDSNCIPAHLMRYTLKPMYPNSNSYYRMVFDTWCLKDLQVPPFNSDKRARQMGKILCHCAQNSDLAGLEILKVDPWDMQNDTIYKVPCSLLK